MGVEESIVNAPLVSLHTENTNNAKSEVTFIINSSTPTLRINLNEHPILFSKLLVIKVKYLFQRFVSVWTQRQ
jgi:hypothetical protein